MQKILAALRAQEVAFEMVRTPAAARGELLLMAGLSSGTGPAAELVKQHGIAVSQAPESLLVRHLSVKGKPCLLLAGSDGRGLMYAELDVANRIAWAADGARPFSEVRDVTERPAAPQRALSIYTMQRAYFESRLHDRAYWERYLDLLAQNRFNSLAVIFGYENGGFLAPPYPYFFDVEEFPDVRMVGITPAQQRDNLAALNRLIRMAHDRGIEVTIGIWDHIYRGGVQSNNTPGSKDALRRPTAHTVWGLTAENLFPYTKVGLAKFLRLVPEVDAIQFRMHGESGLKRGEQAGFWKEIFQLMEVQAPRVRFDARAKGLPDDVIETGLESGVELRIATKYWMEQMGLPFHPTHVNPPNQFDRRHSYADLLRYPQRYKMHWRLWNGGTSRILLWGDPEYVRRFVESTKLYDGEGFEVNEPLCTKMQAQAHDAQPFELLNREHQYCDYEFERYWHFFQVFGRLGYNPDTPAEVWQREFERRFGKEAAPHVEKALHHASQVLPRIVAACYPYSSFPMTRGWAEKQRLGDLPKYAMAEGSDIAQFASFDGEAEMLLKGGETAKVRPGETSRWFAKASQDILSHIAEVQAKAGRQRTKELDSTIVDLTILAQLARYHSRRIPAAVAYRLYKRSGDATMLDEAMARERQAIEEWRKLVATAGDVYTDDLAMGSRQAALCGHWKDELTALEVDLSKLEQERHGAKTSAISRSTTPRLLEAAFADTAPSPTVRHTPIAKATAGEPLTITADVTSPAGVKWVRLRYRAVNQHFDFATMPMRPTGRGDEYQVVVPANEISPKWDFMYYLEAMDRAGQGRIHPDLDNQTPYVVVRLQRK